jgi:hypothetical protein
LRRPVRLARIASAIPVNKPPVRSFSPARTPTPRAKDMGSTASRHSLRARRPAQFPIEPAAPPVPHPPRFRALALFGRRPPERVDRLGIPASENLHKTGNRGGGKARCSRRYEGLASAGGALRFDRAATKSSWDAIVDRLVVSIFKIRSVLGGSVGPARNAW